eukprot:1484040-Amphidinium_carterae.1
MEASVARRLWAPNPITATKLQRHMLCPCNPTSLLALTWQHLHRMPVQLAPKPPIDLSQLPPRDNLADIQSLCSLDSLSLNLWECCLQSLAARRCTHIQHRMTSLDAKRRYWNCAYDFLSGD